MQPHKDTVIKISKRYRHVGMNAIIRRHEEMDAEEM